jgi:hypothetical protein
MRALGLALLLAAAPGCLRNRIDRCAEIPPHPECAPLDAGRDATSDGEVPDTPGDDVPGEDTPGLDAGAVDAGGASDVPASDARGGPG